MFDARKQTPLVKFTFQQVTDALTQPPTALSYQPCLRFLSWQMTPTGAWPPSLQHLLPHQTPLRRLPLLPLPPATMLRPALARPWANPTGLGPPASPLPTRAHRSKATGLPIPRGAFSEDSGNPRKVRKPLVAAALAAYVTSVAKQPRI